MGIFIFNNKQYLISTIDFPPKIYFTTFEIKRKAIYIIQAWWIKYKPKKIDNFYTNDYYKIE